METKFGEAGPRLSILCNWVHVKTPDCRRCFQPGWCFHHPWKILDQWSRVRKIQTPGLIWKNKVIPPNGPFHRDIWMINGLHGDTRHSGNGSSLGSYGKYGSWRCRSHCYPFNHGSFPFINKFGWFVWGIPILGNLHIYILLAKGLSHISWAEVTSTPCNSELEESHINWAKVTSKYQNPNGTPAFKECCYISKNEENIAHTEVFTYV